MVVEPHAQHTILVVHQHLHRRILCQIPYNNSLVTSTTRYPPIMHAYTQYTSLVDALKYSSHLARGQVPFPDGFVLRPGKESLSASFWICIQLKAVDSARVTILWCSSSLQIAEIVRATSEACLKAHVRLEEKPVIGLQA